MRVALTALTLSLTAASAFAVPTYQVPEPEMFALLAIVGAALVFFKRRDK